MPYKQLYDLVKNTRGFPIGLIAFIGNAIFFKERNKRNKNKSTDYKYHAEFNFTEFLKKYSGEELDILISIPPCKSCAELLLEHKKKIKKIYYIADWWNKHEKRYIKKSNIPLAKVRSKSKILKLIRKKLYSAKRSHYSN